MDARDMREQDKSHHFPAGQNIDSLAIFSQCHKITHSPRLLLRVVSTDSSVFCVRAASNRSSTETNAKITKMMTFFTFALFVVRGFACSIQFPKSHGSDNQLVGSLPEPLSKLQVLESLDLSSNKVCDVIPRSMVVWTPAG